MNLDTPKRGVNSALNYQITKRPPPIMTARSGEQYILAFKTSLTVWFPISEMSQYSQMRWWFEVDCTWDTMNCRTVSAESADT